MCWGLLQTVSRCAGVTSTLAMFPLETVRTRLAVDHRRYMNVPNALRTIAAEEGVLALYRVRLAWGLLECAACSARLHGEAQSKVSWRCVWWRARSPGLPCASFGAECCSSTEIDQRQTS